MTDAELKKLREQAREISGGTLDKDVLIAMINAEAKVAESRNIAEGLRILGQAIKIRR